MALRVLLADESSTIKKVMQLALQDFGVEVKAVPVGVDVIPVAKSFQPDIIFADVLLAKKSGYEVCGEIKATTELKNTPVVLMWSGFMDIDEAKATQCKADRRLEKPFDADTLRSIVKELVPTTKGNVLSNYLSFPQMPEFEEPKAQPSAQTKSTDLPVYEPSTDSTSYDLEEPEDFQQVPLPRVSQGPMSQATPGQTTEESEPWSSNSLDRFRINIPKEDLSLDQSLVNFEDASIELSSGAGEIHLSDLDSQGPVRQTTGSFSQTAGTASHRHQPSTQSFSPASIDMERAEQILKEQVREVLQDIAWKIIPDIAERVVREEIEKLLKDAERLS
ncbi:MAG: hypothetical protein BroJett040_07110 [Oligoflexia bacterium]|nr:MAG: hypothetical protein BroJett040_07110 [Oligoflexia bacterium]